MRHRMGFSPQERRLRSELHRLLENADAFIHGSLIEMERCCGNPNCRCALKGEKHRSLYLSLHQKGAPRMKCLPRESHDQVRRWAENYQQVRVRLEALSQMSWQKLLTKREFLHERRKDLHPKATFGLRRKDLRPAPAMGADPGYSPSRTNQNRDFSGSLLFDVLVSAAELQRVGSLP